MHDHRSDAHVIFALLPLGLVVLGGTVADLRARGRRLGPVEFALLLSRLAVRWGAGQNANRPLGEPRPVGPS